MDIATRIYDQILSLFPEQFQWAVSLGILVILILILAHFLRKSLFFLVLLIIFVPASIPVIKNLLSQILSWLQTKV